MITTRQNKFFLKILVFFLLAYINNTYAIEMTFEKLNKLKQARPDKAMVLVLGKVGAVDNLPFQDPILIYNTKSTGNEASLTNTDYNLAYDLFNILLEHPSHEGKNFFYLEPTIIETLERQVNDYLKNKSFKFDAIVINWDNINHYYSESAVDRFKEQYLQTGGDFIEKGQRKSKPDIAQYLNSLRTNNKDKKIALIIGRPHIDPLKNTDPDTIWVYNDISYIPNVNISDPHLSWSLLNPHDTPEGFEFKFDKIMIDYSTLKFIQGGFTEHDSNGNLCFKMPQHPLSIICQKYLTIGGTLNMELGTTNAEHIIYLLNYMNSDGSINISNVVFFLRSFNRTALAYQCTTGIHLMNERDLFLCLMQDSHIEDAFNKIQADLVPWFPKEDPGRDIYKDNRAIGRDFEVMLKGYTGAHFDSDDLFLSSRMKGFETEMQKHIGDEVYFNLSEHLQKIYILRDTENSNTTPQSQDHC